jgi:hypothetical protein
MVGPLSENVNFRAVAFFIGGDTREEVMKRGGFESNTVFWNEDR